MDALEWKSVPMDVSNITMEELQMFGGIEEISDYEILGSDSKTVAKPIKRKKEKCKNSKPKKVRKVELKSNDDLLEDENDEVDVSAWGFYLHDSLLKGLKRLKFQKPTKIQELTIPAAIRGNQDILGAAETGSGKTLAFGIPIVNNIIGIKERREEENKPYTV
ncbi:ATP-dependent RNA helicase DDX24 [Trichonephila inaurata madagascariensis]|uniref:ATP-dependent RNA helicase n=1 Tax=Trichonephila inaurata madagascariensis TaxID=2747483 RepID=A0A8X7C242_9ARAC|nr:ATP-dependent RNA helicase DDX24 [Trichonephila inaurata madagascariensis]